MIWCCNNFKIISKPFIAKYSVLHRHLFNILCKIIIILQQPLYILKGIEQVIAGDKPKDITVFTKLPCQLFWTRTVFADDKQLLGNKQIADTFYLGIPCTYSTEKRMGGKKRSNIHFIRDKPFQYSEEALTSLIFFTGFPSNRWDRKVFQRHTVKLHKGRMATYHDYFFHYYLHSTTLSRKPRTKGLQLMQYFFIRDFLIAFHQ